MASVIYISKCPKKVNEKPVMSEVSPSTNDVRLDIGGGFIGYLY